MKVKKKFNVVLSAIFMMGLGMGFASCSDDNKNMSDNPGSGDDNKTEAQYEQEVQGWTLITQLTDEGKAPDGWENKTFEPTIGSAAEGDPYTRIVATNTMESAATRFAELVGNPQGFSENTSDYNYSIEGIGKLSYQRGSENGQYLAQVTVDLKQVPHLKKILYQTPEQSGNNGSFTGAAYYRFGDVVMDSEGYYWICVRPAFGKEGKQDSHWICLSRTLPDENLDAYKTSTGNQNYLPTGIYSSTKHIQNCTEMFYAMLHPEDWNNNLSGSPKPDMFDDFSFKNYQYHNIYFWQLVCRAWQDQDLFSRVLGVSKQQLDDGLKKGLHFLHSGYSWWWTSSWWCNLYEATYKNGTGKKSNMHDVSTSKPKKDMHNIIVDAKTGDKVGTVNGAFFDNDSNVRWYVRCKTGAQLSSNGKFHEKTAISGVQEIYVYNQLHGADLNQDPEVTTKDMTMGIGDSYYGDSYYRMGDVVKDEDGALWFCIQLSGVPEQLRDEYLEYGVEGVYNNFKMKVMPSQYTWFVSLTPKGTSGQSLFEGDGQQYYTNLPTLNQAKYISHILAYTLWDGHWSKNATASLKKAYRNILQYAKVDLTKLVVRRDSLFDAGTNGAQTNHCQNCFVNLAYSDASNAAQQKQAYMRCIIDGCGMDTDSNGNPKPGSRINYDRMQDSYTTGNYTTKMYIQDVGNINMVRQYAYDPWVTLPWFTLGNTGPDQKDGKATDIYPHEKILEGRYSQAVPERFLWDEQKVDYSNPELTSMYKEPITILRVMRVKDRGVKPTESVDGKKLTEEFLCTYDGNRDTYGDMSGFLSNLGEVAFFFNGNKYKLKDIPFLGQK